MLNDRRNCFLGLINGLDILRVCWPSGEAFRGPRLKGWRTRVEGRRGLEMGEAVFSDTGEEASKISERANEEPGFERGRPLPNLKEGSCASGFGLWGMDVVLKPLALDKVGLKGFDLLRS